MGKKGKSGGNKPKGRAGQKQKAQKQSSYRAMAHHPLDDTGAFVATVTPSTLQLSAC